VVKRVLIGSTALWIRVSNRVRGVDRYPDPRGYFGAGGLAEAEALCA
jgi:hypothetical protein